jgi:hypothetical protein
MWVNVGEFCGTGDIPARSDESVYVYNSEVWKSTLSGRILTARAHAHDGGVNSILYINGEVACFSHMVHGGRPGYVDASGVAHISGASACTDVGTLIEGDELNIEAWYDSSMITEHYSKKDDVMTLILMYLG